MEDVNPFAVAKPTEALYRQPRPNHPGARQSAIPRRWRTPGGRSVSNSRGVLPSGTARSGPERFLHPAAPAIPARPARTAEDKPMGETIPKITVFYDGACPHCVHDRERYEQWAGPASKSVCWFDITGQDEQLRALGIDPRRALTELHVVDEHQRIRSELDAYILLLEKIPWLKPLAWLIGRPGIRSGLARLYRWSVARRLRRSGRWP